MQQKLAVPVAWRYTWQNFRFCSLSAVPWSVIQHVQETVPNKPATVALLSHFTSAQGCHVGVIVYLAFIFKVMETAWRSALKFFIFILEDGGDILFRNVGKHVQVYMVLQSRRRPSTCLLTEVKCWDVFFVHVFTICIYIACKRVRKLCGAHRILCDVLAQLFPTFDAFHGSWNFVFVTPSIPVLSQMNPINTPDPTSLRSDLIAFLHSRVSLTSCVFPWRFQPKLWTHFLRLQCPRLYHPL